MDAAGPNQGRRQQLVEEEEVMGLIDIIITGVMVDDDNDTLRVGTKISVITTRTMAAVIRHHQGPFPKWV